MTNLRTRRRPTVTTCVALGALAAELIALRTRPEETLCPDLRLVIRNLDERAGNRAGQIAFTAVYAGFSAWFLPHLLRGVESSAEAIADLLDGATEGAS